MPRLLERAADFDIPQAYIDEPDSFRRKPWQERIALLGSLYEPITAELILEEAERYLETKELGDPLKGYYFHVLKRQGENPPGGRYDYVINGNMIAGFALVAYPADYGNSGVMTFVVSHHGKVYQKDLGAFTGMLEYDPDASWTAVEEASSNS